MNSMPRPPKNRGRNRHNMLVRTHGKEGRTSDIHERLPPHEMGLGRKNPPLDQDRPGRFRGSLVLFDGAGFLLDGGVDILWHLMDVNSSQW